MKGCSHAICNVCAMHMKKMESNMTYPLSNVFTLQEAPVSCLKCPYCRKQEPVNLHDLRIYSMKEYITTFIEKYTKIMNEAYPEMFSSDELLEMCEDINIEHKYRHYKSHMKNSYKLWIELELRFDGEKSILWREYKRYMNGKKRPYAVIWEVDKHEIKLDDFKCSNTNYKHRKHNLSNACKFNKLKQVNRPMNRF
jgi:hypothetical protein